MANFPGSPPEFRQERAGESPKEAVKESRCWSREPRASVAPTRLRVPESILFKRWHHGRVTRHKLPTIDINPQHLTKQNWFTRPPTPPILLGGSAADFVSQKICFGQPKQNLSHIIKAAFKSLDGFMVSDGTVAPACPSSRQHQIIKM